MTTNASLKSISHSLLAMALATSAQATSTDISTVPLSTYSAPSSTDVKPNVLFVLDDSGSMDWDFMPDWACASYSTQSPSCSSTGQDPLSARSEYLFRNAGYNGIYYNPAVRYTPAVGVNADGTTNAAAYPSMTGVSTTTGGDSAASAASPNWKSVKDDAFGVQASTSSNLTQSLSYFYTFVAGEWCDSPHLTNCSSTKSGAYTYPATLRWCNSSALTTCRATFNDASSQNYTYARAPSPNLATITISGSSSTSVSSIQISNREILSAATTASSNASTVAAAIAANINKCTAAATGSCQVSGYAAYSSGTSLSATVTIAAPLPANLTSTPTVVQSGTMTVSAAAFSASSVPGANLLTVITPDRSSYPYPGATTKAATRTDCAASTCTYAEEMANYANWWTYYRTRMQMMKTAATTAFSKLDTVTDIANGVSRFRVGYMTINNNTSSDFLNLGEFKTTQKSNWYSKFISASPSNSTPLRAALSKAGRLYAGKLNGTTLNGSTVVDPLQFSCQQNYTILSTDGFWNESSGYVQMDGSTSVANQDGALPRPYYDGGTGSIQQQTSSLQQRTAIQTAQKGTLQQQTSQLTKSTSQRTASTSQLTASTSQLTKSTSQLQIRTSSDKGKTWTAWGPTAACTPVSSGTNRTQCQIATTGPTGVASCTPVTASAGNSYTATTCNTLTGGPTGVASCTPTAASAGNSYTATSCNTLTSGPTGVASCTPATASSSNSYTTTTCNTVTTGPTPTASCTSATASSSNNYTATTCNTSVTASYANAASCSATTTPDSNGFTTQCQYVWGASAATSTCTPAYVANDYFNQTVYKNCTTTPGTWVNASSCTVTGPDASGNSTQCQYTAWSSWTTVSACTSVAQSTASPYTVATASQCRTTSSGGTSNTLADVAAYYYNTDLRSSNASNGTGTCTGPVVPPATTANDLCADNVPSNGVDTASTQHMTTFTLGLGSTGQMLFSPTYLNDTSGDYYDVYKGNTANPSNGICLWQSSGACNWPTPASNSLNNIDDLWHAAVDGRGSYFSATDPASLSSALTNTLATIINIPRAGTAAAAASSNPNVSTSDNYVFSSYYKSVEWDGELIRQQLDTTTGLLGSQDWSAMTMLDCATTTWTAGTHYLVGSSYRNGSSCYSVGTEYTSGATFGTLDTDNTTVASTASPTSRTLYTKGTTGLISFTWSTLSSAQQAYFTAPYITYVAGPPSSGLSQFCTTGTTCLNATQQSNNTVAAGGAAGESLVNFLRGDRSQEGAFFRQRTHVLGDIVSSEARYVKVPIFNYTDSGYSAYKTLRSSRNGAVYVAANDGMLHAFDSGTGQELWGYIPGLVLPNIYQLADKNYANQHQYFVDGSPEVGDICPTAPSSACTDSQWKTILVGGLNRGGKGYYALDITDPANPVLLWEFTDANLGYTYGNPRIGKLKDGTWVVMFASGYNNADGIGRLYVVNANTGVLIRSISTGAGSVTTPSGLARISAHAPLAMTDSTIAAVYGGDLLGNLWRFDVNGDIGASGYDAQLLVSFTDAGGNAEPITAKPTVVTVSGKPVVYVGTGRYLGVSDVTSTSLQTFYAVKDNLGATTYGSPRNASNGFVQQTLTSDTCPSSAPATVCNPGQSVRTSTSNGVDWNTNNGWFVDFLTGGERSVTDSALALGTLVFTTITPNNTSANACGVAGADNSASYAYFLNYLTGGAVVGSGGVSGVSLGNVIATRPVLVELPGGLVEGLIRTSGGTGTGSVIVKPPIKVGSSSTQRVSWRELVN